MAQGVLLTAWDTAMGKLLPLLKSFVFYNAPLSHRFLPGLRAARVIQHTTC